MSQVTEQIFESAKKVTKSGKMPRKIHFSRSRRDWLRGIELASQEDRPSLEATETGKIDPDEHFSRDLWWFFASRAAEVDSKRNPAIFNDIYELFVGVTVGPANFRKPKFENLGCETKFVKSGAVWRAEVDKWVKAAREDEDEGIPAEGLKYGFSASLSQVFFVPAFLPPRRSTTTLSDQSERLRIASAPATGLSASKSRKNGNVSEKVVGISDRNALG
ncbi:hypothetical protein C8R45DRAFT_1078534 [Mycena sanguinolenta]|nr:hypothetical protein C8R45DRAFT_1078534 [Mycena sanguinolenta]